MEGFDRAALQAATPLFVHRRVARFQDVDAAGAVFFARILEYFHDAYVAFLDERGVALSEVLATRSWSAPLRRVEADFLAPIRFGDALEIGLVRARWDRSVVILGHRICGTTNRALAVGVTEHLFIDPESRRPVPPPAAALAAFRELADA